MYDKIHYKLKKKKKVYYVVKKKKMGRLEKKCFPGGE